MKEIKGGKGEFFAEETYKNGNKYFFPDIRQKKDNNFFLTYFEAIYSEYVKDKGGIPYSRKSDYSLYRLYGEGNQPTEKYMNILCPLPEGKSKDSEREGWMNISWDILSVAPKFRRIFIGLFEKIELDVIATAINDKALESKDEYKWKLWADKQLETYNKGLDEEMGVEHQAPEWLPSTMQELEMFMNETFKLPTEISMEMALNYSFYLSQWPELKKKMLGDWFDLGIAATQDYVDPIDEKVKCKYLDPARLILRYSRDSQYSNIDYWAHIEEWTIAELRQKSGFDEPTLYSIAHSYNNFGDNVTNFDWTDYYSLSVGNSNTNTQLPYDNYKVNVMFGEFITSETKKVKTVKLKNGATKTYEDKKVPQNEWMDASKEDRSVDSVPYQVAMSGYWVLGTKFVFSCGKSYVQPRPDKKNPKLSINVYKYSNKSILASIIPNLDSFQLTWLKLLNAKAIAAPAGLQIEIGTLENLTIGGEEFTPLEILSIRRATGDLLYKATTHFSEINNPAGAAHPVQELQGGLGNQLNECIQAMEYDVKLIRDLTGINESIDASSPKERVPVTTAQMSATAAVNSLQPVYSGYVTVKENVAKKMVSRYQTLASNGKLRGYYPSLGSNVVSIFEMGSDVSAEEYGIKLRVRPTDEMKDAIRKAALESQALGKKQGGISHADYLYIEDKIQDNQLKYAWLYLDYKERENEKAMEKAAQDNIQGQGQQQQDLEQVKMQSEAARIKAETDSRISLENVMSQNRLKELMAAHDNKMEEISLQNQGKLQGEVVKGQVKGALDNASEESAESTK